MMRPFQVYKKKCTGEDIEHKVYRKKGAIKDEIEHGHFILKDVEDDADIIILKSYQKE